MNKFYTNLNLLLALLLVVAPACKRKKATVVTQPNSRTAYSKDASKPGLFEEEDLEGFVLTTTEPKNSFQSQDSSLLFDTDEEILLADLQVEQSRHGFRPIYFEFDKDRIRPGQQASIEFDLARAKELTLKGQTIVIEGHACQFAGSAKYNMHLSERRARFVRQYFIENGIPRSKLKVVGRGSEMCVVPTGDKEQQAPNRRVEFLVMD